MEQLSLDGWVDSLRRGQVILAKIQQLVGGVPGMLLHVSDLPGFELADADKDGRLSCVALKTFLRMPWIAVRVCHLFAQIPCVGVSVTSIHIPNFRDAFIPC